MDTTTDALSHVRSLMARATGDEKHEESSTSTLDALWVLYDRVLRIDPSDPDAPDRDRFILSKGHGPVALYAILAARGFFPEAWLDDFLEHGGRLGLHPDRTLVPGIEASTGSLGHGLPIGVGVAQAVRAKGLAAVRVVVLCGDAELNEGSNWEAITLAPALSLANLTMVVIDNHSSMFEPGSWTERLGAFGWTVREVDGHDHDALEHALTAAGSAPLAVIADVPAGEW
ncbi:MAG: thiamine pyrophosphate-dependent enzyme [Acidimicrobiia bacterium]